MFIITERQYSIIMKQAQDCWPMETGGFLGGHDNKILGVLPIPNKNPGDQTTQFALTGDDIELAYRFLVKHKLEYLGVYHTHPRGIPYPSPQDLAHNQKYLFIVGLQDRRKPELYAWRVENKQVFAEDIKIISDFGATVIDIRTGQPKLTENSAKEAADKLAHDIDTMISGKMPDYPKLEPGDWDPSTFSTYA
ncbi:MAG: Mov34/MPN/PAD-1 family protein [Candidatus Margulisbacteria bacterium]|nr:Mov34/MPN/PAD-1 family protein [Candidatus Margulisiibacteriota bacterium]MBU1617640.1 Mov34/MPN/PAD-1 family protein [Candidatus Margulisiibacteriota bacterium]